MGRQRRGVLGCTNLPSLTHNCEARAHSHHLTRQPPSSRDTRGVLQDAKAAGRVEATSCDNDPEMDRRLRLKPMRRDKFKLPLISSGSTGGTATRAGQCRTKRKLSPREALLAEHEKAKQVLVEAIEAHETASKSFKNEHWYASPIGFGSRKSVLLAALKSRDPGGSGLLTAKQLVEALRAPNFGLDEQQARSLLSHFDAQLVKEDAKVPYRAFVKHLRLPEERPNQPGQDPTMFYQESYINRVRMHAAKLIEKAAAVDLAAVLGSPRDSLSSALPPLTTSGPRRDATGPQNNDADRLSFEFDKARKQRRAEVKSRVLLAHMNRLEAFSQQQQKLVEHHEAMRLAAKAIHRHAHFEQAFQEENRRLRVAQRQPKGMLGSPIATMHHNVSKDSMFCVEPV